MPTFSDLGRDRQAAQIQRLQQVMQSRGQSGGYPGFGVPGGQSGFLPQNLQMPMGFGGSNAQNIQTMQGYQQQIQQALRDDDSQREFSLSGGTDRSRMREMTGLEKGLTGIRNFGEKIGNITNWDPNKSILDVGNDLLFLGSLPGQMFQGLTEGLSQGYEAITGNPVLEGDLESGMMPDYDMDLSQRFASGVNAGINVGGLFTGGSARGIGLLGNLATGGRAMNNLAKGRVGENLFKSAAGKFGGQLGFDAAEEMGEEFGQAYLDAIRFKTLDKEDTLNQALQGAKWGAFGGAAMSGGVQGIQALRGRSNAQQNQQANPNQGNAINQPANPNQQSQVQDSPAWYNELQRSGGSAQRMTSTQQAVLDNMTGSKRRIAGSGTFKMSYADKSLRRNSGRCGSESLQSIWESGFDSQERIADSLRATQEEVRDAIYNHTYNQQQYGNAAEALNALKQDKIDNQGDRLIVAMGRNPDTKNGGVNLVLDSFFDGSGIDVHPWVAPIVGGDFDGDNSTIYFDRSKTNILGFPTDIMRGPEGWRPVTNKDKDGWTEADWYFSGMDPALKGNRQTVRDAFETAFAQHAPNYTGSIDQYVDDFMQAHSSSLAKGEIKPNGFESRAYKAGDGALYAQVFNKMADDIYDSTGDEWAAREAVEDVLDTFQKTLVYDVQDFFANQQARTKQAMEYAADAEIREFINRGTLGRFTKPAQLYEYLGAISYSLTGQGNPAFRQYAMLNFTAKDHQLTTQQYQDFAKVSRTPDVFQALVRASFRMEAAGVSPSTAIEGLIDSAVITRTIGDFGESRRIRSQKDLDDFFEAYVENFNDMIDIYNDAQKTYTQNGLERTMNAVYKNKLEGVDDSGFARAFMKIFGDTSVAALFDNSLLPEDLQGLTLRQLVEPQSQRLDRQKTAMMLFNDQGVQAFINRLASNAITEKRAVYDKWRANFENDTVTDMAQKIITDSNGNLSLDPNDQAAFFAYIDGVSMSIGPRNALKAGLYGIEILNTRVGKMLTSKIASERINAAFSVGVRSQFDEYVKLLRSDDPRLKQYAIQHLDDMAKISPLHHAIVNELLRNERDENGERKWIGSSALLDTLTSLDHTWEEKLHAFDEMKTKHGFDDDSDLLDLLQDEDSDFALSSVSNRIREASDCIVRAKKLLFDQDRADVSQLRERINSGGANPDQFVDWFKELITTSQVQVNLDLLGAEAYAASTVAKGAMEKGTNFGAAIHTATSMDLAVNGGQMSFIDTVMSVPNGVINMNDFTSNRKLFMSVLADPNVNLRVVDPVTGKSVVMNRRAIIKDACPDAAGSEFTPEVILGILEKWPQLCGWLANSQPQPSVEGTIESSSQARTTSLTDDFSQYVSDHNSINAGSNDTLVTREVRKAKNAISMLLLNQVWYRPALIRCLKDVDTSVNSYEALSAELKKLHHQMVDGWFAIAVTQKGGYEFQGMMNENFSNVLDRTLSEAQSILQFAIDNLGDMYAGGQFTRNALWSIGEHIATSDFVSKTTTALGNMGVNISAPQTSSLMQGYLDMGKQAVQEQTAMLDDLKAFAQAFALSIESNPNLSFSPNVDVRNEFINQINNNAQLTQAQKDQAIKIIDDQLDESSHYFNRSIAVDNNIITAADLTQGNMTEGQFRQHWYDLLIRIKESVGDPIEDRNNDEEIVDILNDAFKKSPEKRTGDLSKIRVLWNNRYFEYRLNKLSGLSGQRVNANAYKSQVEYFENIREFADTIKDSVEDMTKVRLNSAIFSDPKYTTAQLPVASFTNLTAEAMANNLMNMDQSGWVPSTVSLNGGMTKQMAGFGFLSRDTISPIPPRPISYQDLAALNTTQHSRDRVAILGNGQITNADLRTVEALYKELQAMDPQARAAVQIGYFDPADNPHGVYDSNTPVSHSLRPDRYKRLPGIIARIIDFSQEAMVLKAKKSLGNRSTLVSENPTSNDYGMSVRQADLRNPQTAYRSMRDKFSRDREAYAANLAEQFNDDGTLSKLGFDDEQAQILAQGLTPGMIVTFADGAQRVFDASYLVNDQLFQQKWNELTANGVGIVAAETMFVTPSEVSYRLMRAASDAADAAQGPAVPGQTVASQQEVQRAVDNAMNDWSDYELGTLTVNEVMSNFNNVGYAWNSPLIAPDFRTPVQYFIDEMNGDSSGAYVNQSGLAEYHSRMLERTNSLYIQGRNLGQAFTRPKKGMLSLGTEKTDYIILQAFLPSTNAMNTSTQKFRTWYGELGAIADKSGDYVKRDSDGYFYRAPNMAAVCEDPNKVRDAIDWGRKTRGKVIIRSDIYKSETLGMHLPFNVSETITRDGISYTVLNPSGDDIYAQQRAGMPTGANMADLHPSQIYGALVDVRNDFITGDANGLAFSPLHDFSRTDRRGKAISVRDLLGKYASASRCKIATQSDLAQLQNVINDDDALKSLFNFNGLKIQGAEITETEGLNKIRNFLNTASRINGDRGYLNRNVSRGDIVALLYDGTKFAPVFVPKTAPRNISVCSVNINETTNKVGVFWDGEVGFDGDNGYMKMALDGESYKMIVRKYNGNSEPKISVNGYGDANQTPLHLVVNADTENGRINGMEKNVFIKDVWYMGRKLGGSLLFEKSTDSKGKPIVKWNGNLLSNMNDKQRADLLDNAWNSSWAAIATGQVDLVSSSDPNASAKNEAIRQVLRQCERYRISPLKVLSSYGASNLVTNPDGTSHYTTATNFDFDTEYLLLFGKMSQRDITWFFNAFNPKLITRPNQIADGSTVMDIYGNTRVYYDGLQGQPDYLPVRWGRHRGIGDEESVTTPSGEARWGAQHMYRRAMDTGYLASEWKEAIEWSDFMLGNNDRIDFIKDPQNTIRRKMLRGESDYDVYSGIPFDRYSTDTWLELKHEKRKREIGRNRTKIRKIYDGEETIESPQSDERIIRAVDKFKSTFGSHWNWRMICMEVDRQNGYTYTDEAHHKISVGEFTRTIEDMIANFNETGIAVRNRVANGKTPNNRYALAMLSNDEIDWFWRSDAVKGKFADKVAFKNAVIEEGKRAAEQIEYITDDPSKKKALITAFEYDYGHHGLSSPHGYIYAGLYTDDIVKSDNIIADALRQSRMQGADNSLFEFDDVLWDELTARQQKILQDIKKMADKENRSRFIIDRDTVTNGRIKVRAEDGRTISAVLDSLTETSKIMALLNPGVFVSNVIDRGFHQGFQNFSLWLGTQYHIGPYASKMPPPNQNHINEAVNDETFIELYSAYRISVLTGNELDCLNAFQSGVEAVRNWRQEQLNKMTRPQKIAAKIYDIQTGSNKFVKGQMRNFLNRFAQFAEVDPNQQFWFQKVGEGEDAKTYFEASITNGGASRWFAEVMGANQGYGASFISAQQAMNSAQQGDMAQRNVFGMMLSEICRKSSLSKFIVTTTISRFPAYSLNVTGRMLNWVMPMSSINYVFTEKMAQIGAKRAEKNGTADPHYELAQVHRSLREAMLVDITHLGVGATAAILVGMAGGIEPPDDEKKWGNVDEWLVCGLRVGDAWWIQDILGAALPLAAFTKSAMEGKPRIDVLIHGLKDACCSNPVIKVADAVGYLMDPEGSLISDYEKDFEQYQNAKGGPPGFLDWMNAQGVGWGLNWVSQFITPSCLREWYQNSQAFERSYKRIYQTTDTGILSEAGQQGYTEYTTYADAQIRRATRRNPMLGFLADLILHPSTGYMAGEMPLTVYRDDAQLASADYWSINGLTPEEQQAKILEIIIEMQSYDSMEDLAKTGFYLDTETKAALSSTVWDTIQELDNWYYGLQQDGMFDYYVMGNGDFTAGQQLVGQIKLDWTNQKKAWKDFYYDKVCSDYLKGMTTYNRYNTSYARDVYGDVYATGIRPQGVLPFVSGPGTTTNPEGTAGYKNDFMTISAVTGEPMDQRALVPTNNYDDEYWPSLEYWSGDQNGNGNSQTYNNWYGDSNSSGGGTTNGTGNADTSSPSNTTGGKKTTSSRKRRKSGGGGGGRRSGGGGSYSSTPNIYARYQIPYASEANVMGRVNRQRANFDYLRPSWETKGSREAYKREDI